MVNYEKLADEYATKFPRISKEDTLMIILGALRGSIPVMPLRGFRSWYEEVAPHLHNHPEILEEIRGNPHGVMHRESMILDGDWMSEPILDRVKRDAA